LTLGKKDVLGGWTGAEAINGFTGRAHGKTERGRKKIRCLLISL